MTLIDFYNRDVLEHTHASVKPRYRRASFLVLGDSISCEVPPVELVQPRDRQVPNLATTTMATARLDSLYPNLFVPGHLLSQDDAHWKLESIPASDRAVVGLYHLATLT
jgi:hypothetical protein